MEWENLGIYKPLHFSMTSQQQVQMQMQVQPSSSSSSSSLQVDEPGAVGVGVGVGLRLGHPAPAPAPAKRSRASYHNMQNPCCQVEGCNLDLKLAKDYHRRHRICETHSKSPKVVVAGMERRFCQQCSRFHDLSEFDDNKRSCRRRLSDHNARRRRVQPDSSNRISPPLIFTNSATTATADHRHHHNVLLNGLPVSLSSSPMSDHNHNVLHMDPHRSTPRLLHQYVPGSMAPDLVSAHTLLSSNNSWSLNEAESSASIDGINVQGSFSPLIRPDFHTTPDNNNIDLLQSSSHHQQYHFFKSSPNYHSTNFYSTQRTL